MISEFPSEPLCCLFGTWWCTSFTCVPGSILCSGCGKSRDLCQTHPETAYGSTSLAALAALKEQLKEQIAEIEKQQAAIEESLLPKTVEEVDMLTKKLKEALEELEARRKELHNKPESAGDK